MKKTFPEIGGKEYKYEQNSQKIPSIFKFKLGSSWRYGLIVLPADKLIISKKGFSARNVLQNEGISEIERLVINGNPQKGFTKMIFTGDYTGDSRIVGMKLSLLTDQSPSLNMPDLYIFGTLKNHKEIDNLRNVEPLAREIERSYQQFIAIAPAVPPVPSASSSARQRS